jgi:hypothetical protein
MLAIRDSNNELSAAQLPAQVRASPTALENANYPRRLALSPFLLCGTLEERSRSRYSLAPASASLVELATVREMASVRPFSNSR